MHNQDLKIKDFARQFSGKLVLPTGKDYDEARQLWNGHYNKFPIGIAFCGRTSDVGRQ